MRLLNADEETEFGSLWKTWKSRVPRTVMEPHQDSENCGVNQDYLPVHKRNLQLIWVTSSPTILLNTSATAVHCISWRMLKVRTVSAGRRIDVTSQCSLIGQTSCCLCLWFSIALVKRISLLSSTQNSSSPLNTETSCRGILLKNSGILLFWPTWRQDASRSTWPESCTLNSNKDHEMWECSECVCSVQGWVLSVCPHSPLCIFT